MNTFSYTQVGIIIVLAVFLGGLLGHELYPTIQIQTLAGSPVGATFSGAGNEYGVIMSPTTGATSSSLLNNSGSDRGITGVNIACEGITTASAGVPTLLVTIATSTAASPVTGSATSTLEMTVTVSTTSANFILASSSPQIATTSSAQIWGANQYLNFSWNATDTANCHVGVNAVQF